MAPTPHESMLAAFGEHHHAPLTPSLAACFPPLIRSMHPRHIACCQHGLNGAVHVLRLLLCACMGLVDREADWCSEHEVCLHLHSW